MYQPKYKVNKIYKSKDGHDLLVTRTDPKEMYDHRIWFFNQTKQEHGFLSEDEFAKLIPTNSEVKDKPKVEPTEADKNRLKAVHAQAKAVEKGLEEKENEKKILDKSKKDKKK